LYCAPKSSWVVFSGLMPSKAFTEPAGPLPAENSSQ
jgi:hypothetical protein